MGSPSTRRCHWYLVVPRTGGTQARWAYDDLNRAVREQDGEGHVTTRAFDADGNRLCEKRPLGGSPLAADAAGAPAWPG